MGKGAERGVGEEPVSELVARLPPRSPSMLLSRSSRLLVRYPSLLRRMSSIYVLPIDPSAPSAAAAPVDAPKLWKSSPAASKPPSTGTTHLFYGDNTSALSSLGDKFGKKKGDERREVVRKAVAGGIKKVRDLGEAVEGSKVLVDASIDPHAAGTSSYCPKTRCPAASLVQLSARTLRSTTSLSRQAPPPPSTRVSRSPFPRNSTYPRCRHRRNGTLA